MKSETDLRKENILETLKTLINECKENLTSEKFAELSSINSVDKSNNSLVIYFKHAVNGQETQPRTIDKIKISEFLKENMKNQTNGEPDPRKENFKNILRSLTDTVVKEQNETDKTKKTSKEEKVDTFLKENIGIPLQKYFDTEIKVDYPVITKSTQTGNSINSINETEKLEERKKKRRVPKKKKNLKEISNQFVKENKYKLKEKVIPHQFSKEFVTEIKQPFSDTPRQESFRKMLMRRHGRQFKSRRNRRKLRRSKQGKTKH